MLKTSSKRQRGCCTAFFSNDARKVMKRMVILHVLGAIYIFLFTICIFSDSWFTQEWKMANNKPLIWTLGLYTINQNVNCTSTDIDFSNFCENVYGKSAGSIKQVEKHLCTVESFWPQLTKGSCAEMHKIISFSFAVLILLYCSVLFLFLGFVSLQMLMFFTNFKNRKLYIFIFICFFLTWILSLVACAIYSRSSHIITWVFHYSGKFSPAYHPAESIPVIGKYCYGFYLLVFILASFILMFILARISIPQFEINEFEKSYNYSGKSICERLKLFQTTNSNIMGAENAQRKHLLKNEKMKNHS